MRAKRQKRARMLAMLKEVAPVPAELATDTIEAHRLRGLAYAYACGRVPALFLLTQPRPLESEAVGAYADKLFLVRKRRRERRYYWVAPMRYRMDDLLVSCAWKAWRTLGLSDDILIDVVRNDSSNQSDCIKLHIRRDWWQLVWKAGLATFRGYCVLQAEVLLGRRPPRRQLLVYNPRDTQTASFPIELVNGTWEVVHGYEEVGNRACANGQSGA